MIEYMRGRRGPSEATEQMVYPSKCGRYKLERHVGIYEDRTIWYALHKHDDQNWWSIISQHRTKNAALKVMEKHARQLLKGKKR